MKNLIVAALLVSALAAGATTFPPGYVGSNIEEAELVVGVQTVTAISLANPASVTITGHNLTSGDLVYLNAGDMVELATGYYTITKTGADTFTVPVCSKSLVATTAVSIADDTVTIAAHGWKDAQVVTYNNGGGASITGLVSGTSYYVRNATTNTVQLSATDNGALIDLSTTGNASQYFTFTTYTTGGTARSGYLAATKSTQYISIINGSSLHTSTVPLYFDTDANARPSAPTIADPSTCGMLDPGQSSDIPAGIRYISMAVSTGKVWVRYRMIQ